MLVDVKGEEPKGSASLDISAFYALGNGVSSKTTFQETHLGNTLIYETIKQLVQKSQGTRNPAQ